MNMFIKVRRKSDFFYISILYVIFILKSVAVVGYKLNYNIVREDMREILITLCQYKKVEIIQGAVYIDHIHIYVSISSKLSVLEFVGYLKGKSALMLHDRHPEMTNKWNRECWARGYYVTTIGNINEETIRKYITEQEEESKK